MFNEKMKKKLTKIIQMRWKKKEKKLIREKRKKFSGGNGKNCTKKSAVRNHFVSKIEILRKIL